MSLIPQKTDIIMVGLVPSPKDLEIARVLGWYRIPLRANIRVITVDFLAFYQPASFKDHKWQIEFFAPVTGHELVLRSQLLKTEADHPRAKEEYFKLQLGPMQRLVDPIKAEDWKRVTFLYTNGQSFLQAKTLKELKIEDSEERRIFSKILRERASTTEQYLTSPFKPITPEIDYLSLIALLSGDYKG